MGQFFASEVTGSYYAVARGKGFDSFGIYAEVNKFLFEVNGVMGSLFKVCESYSETHLYLNENFVKEDPVPRDVAPGVAPTDPPYSLPEGGGGYRPLPYPRGKNKRYFQGQHVGSRGAQCDKRSFKSERR
jgi:hypothetical protein